MKFVHVGIIIAMAACVATFTGCSTGTPVVAASGGAYTVTKSGTTGFTPLGVLRKKAYKEANRFAASKGMVVEVISVNEVPAGFARWPQVDLRFRLVSSADRDSGTGATVLTIGNQSSHDAMGNATEAATTIQISKEVEFYNELKRLGELKDKGLLTEDEFQKEKKRLLDARGKVAEPDGAANGSQPIRSETNRTSSAGGSRR